MIKKLILKNFQSHKHTVLEFHEGVNCVIGSSDVGKTAILRALRWLAWNRPIGDEFRSTWGGKTVVSVITDDHVVKRIKDTNRNAYIVDGNQLKAIRADVPEEVAKALNLQELNLQSQFDRPFLLDSSPGEVASHFNRIAHLDKIDTSIKNVQSWYRQLNQDIESDEATVKELEGQLEKYDELDELDQQVTNLEQLDVECSNKTEELEMLTQLIESIRRTKRKVSRISKLTKLAEPVADTMSLFKQRTTLTQERNDILGMLLSISQATKHLTNTSEKVVSLNKQFAKEFPDVCPLCNQAVKGKRK